MNFDAKTYTVDYRDISVSGKKAKDSVSLYSGVSGKGTPMTLNPFNFLMVSEGKGFTTWHADGMLGLAPSTKEKTSLVEQMHDESLIEKSMFSLCFSRSGNSLLTSKLWFGGYDLDYIKSLRTDYRYKDEAIEQAIQWIDLPKDETAWKVKLNLVRV